MSEKNVSSVITAVITTAIVVGGSVYLWTNQNTDQQDFDQNGQTPGIIAEIPVKEDAAWQNYSFENYSFQYPAGYTIKEPTQNIGWLEMKGSKGKIQIFKKSDFKERPFGFSGEETQEDIDGYVPKENRQINNENIPMGPVAPSAYEIWLFWPKGDKATQQEIQKIADSVKVQ